LDPISWMTAARTKSPSLMRLSTPSPRCMVEGWGFTLVCDQRTKIFMCCTRYHNILMLYSHCTHAVLMLYSCCTHAVLMLYSCCTHTKLYTHHHIIHASSQVSQGSFTPDGGMICHLDSELMSGTAHLHHTACCTRMLHHATPYSCYTILMLHHTHATPYCMLHHTHATPYCMLTPYSCYTILMLHHTACYT
jgi:hypothetical protein